MRHFIYSYSEGKPPRDGSGIRKTVRVWRIVRNQPVFVGEHTETFVDKNQLVLICMQKHNALPRKAWEKDEHGRDKYGMCWHLKEAGIASFTEI